MASNRKHTVATALCSELSLDREQFSRILEKDIKSLCLEITSSSPSAAALLKDNEFMKWVDFADKFPEDPGLCFKALSELNEDLVKVSVLLGHGFEHTAADIIVFSIVHSTVIGLSKEDRIKLPHLLRWMDYIQSKEVAANLFERIEFEKGKFVPPMSTLPLPEVKTLKKGEADSNVKNPEPQKKECGSSEDVKPKKQADLKIATADNQTTVDKKVPKKEVDEKDKDISVSLLKIQIGHIRNAWKHPSADSLLVEEIDVGEAKCRQVVSGLAKYFTPEDLTNRHVVLITNMKPSKLRDMTSEGMVLCASNDDHTVVEPLLAPEGAKVGEFVSFSGHDGKPEDVLNPKKKQFDKIAVNLFTDENGVATFKGIPFMTSAGPCTSTLSRASIK